MRVPADLAERLIVKGEYFYISKGSAQCREPLAVVEGTTLAEFLAIYKDGRWWFERETGDADCVLAGTHDAYGQTQYTIWLAPPKQAAEALACAHEAAPVAIL